MSAQHLTAHSARRRPLRRAIAPAAAITLVAGFAALPGASPATAAPGESAADRARGPVGSRTAVLVTHPQDPGTSEPSQLIRRAVVEQDRAPATISARVVLQGAPVAEAPTTLLVAFGNIRAGGEACDSRTDSQVEVSTSGASTANVARQGAVVTITDLPLAAAANARWDCAYVQTENDNGDIRYDTVLNSLTDRIDKPNLSFVVQGKKLRPRGFTPVTIGVRNADDTVAPARRARLDWRGQGVEIRGERAIGTILPGTTERVRIFVRSTARTGKIFLTVKAVGATKRTTLRVTRSRR